jgi:predicted oxidoreductase
VKKSLERLQLDYIDVLQCHRFDPDTPIEETMQALHDVVQAGYARYIGMSSCYAWQCAYLFKLKVNNCCAYLGHSSRHAEYVVDAGALGCSIDGAISQTMLLRITSRPSSRCRTIIRLCTARRSAKCSPHSSISVWVSSRGRH